MEYTEHNAKTIREWLELETEKPVFAFADKAYARVPLTGIPDIEYIYEQDFARIQTVPGISSQRALYPFAIWDHKEKVAYSVQWDDKNTLNILGYANVPQLDDAVKMAQDILVNRLSAALETEPEFDADFDSGQFNGERDVMTVYVEYGGDFETYFEKCARNSIEKLLAGTKANDQEIIAAIRDLNKSAQLIADRVADSRVFHNGITYLYTMKQSFAEIDKTRHEDGGNIEAAIAICAALKKLPGNAKNVCMMIPAPNGEIIKAQSEIRDLRKALESGRGFQTTYLRYPDVLNPFISSTHIPFAEVRALVYGRKTLWEAATE